MILKIEVATWQIKSRVLLRANTYRRRLQPAKSKNISQIELVSTGPLEFGLGPFCLAGKIGPFFWQASWFPLSIFYCMILQAIDYFDLLNGPDRAARMGFACDHRDPEDPSLCVQSSN
ncbi:hypothetical protein ACE6H2_025613 [Prunus campanulata]